jgi:hypothetical protein
MLPWIKARLGERNSRRALAVVVAVAAYTKLVDPAQLGLSVGAVEQIGLLWLAMDQFATKEAPK